MQQNYTKKTFKITKLLSMSGDDQKTCLECVIAEYLSKIISKIMVK